MTTMKNSLADMDSLMTPDSVRTVSPLKPALSTNSSHVSSVLSSPTLHKRRPSKRVRFALTLEPVEEDSLSSSPEVSPLPVSKLNNRIVDPWSSNRPLPNAYIEHLRKQDALSSQVTQTDRIPSVSPDPSSIEPTTYTHTFVIQSKSPTVVIDSITVSTPPLHLPQIIRRKEKAAQQQSSTISSYLKQQLILTTPSRILHTKKLSNSTSQRHHYVSIHATPKRSESQTLSTSVLQSNNRPVRLDHSHSSKVVKDQGSTKKMTELAIKPVASTTNQINHFPARSTLPNYLKKPRIPSRSHRTNDELNLIKHKFFQDHDNNYLLQPIIPSTH